VPQQAAVRLSSGERAVVPLEVAVADDVPAGNYVVDVELARSDGPVELRRSCPVEHLGQRARVVLPVAEDAYVVHRYPDRNMGPAKVLLVDGGDKKMRDSAHALTYLKFRLDVPGKPVTAMLRIHNAGNPTDDSGRVRLVTGPWTETKLTYQSRPAPGEELARLGRVASRQAVECPLKIDLASRAELSLAIDPVNCDGVDYVSREGGQPAELVIEYQPGVKADGRR
jgi:hypothetical protein